MKHLILKRALIWLSAAATCAALLGLTMYFTYVPGGEVDSLVSFPFVPFLPFILLAFLYGVWRVNHALSRYTQEAEACEFVSQIIAEHYTPAEVQAHLSGVSSGMTAIGRRIRHACETSDFNSAMAVIQIPQELETEEDKTFGALHFLRGALVLLGLLSTVIFFARAFTSVDISQAGSLVLLTADLQKALTMTMAGIATSVVLGTMAAWLFDVYQKLRGRVDELTATMLPRLLPRYEKGTEEEPGPALVLEKLQDYFREVEEWKSSTGAEVDRLTEVLGAHGDVLSRLPAVSLPDSFSELNIALTEVATSITGSNTVTDRALQVLSEDRSLDVNAVVKLLMEVRTDTESVKSGQAALLEKVLPKQTEAVEKLTAIRKDLQDVAENLKQAAESQKKSAEVSDALKVELSRIARTGGDEQLAGLMREMVAAVKDLKAETKTMSARMTEAIETLVASNAENSRHLSSMAASVARSSSARPRTVAPPVSHAPATVSPTPPASRSFSERFREWLPW